MRYYSNTHAQLTPFRREANKVRTEALEIESRESKEQLAELARTANEYSDMIRKKDERIHALTEDTMALKQEHDTAMREILGLQTDIDTLAAELEDEKSERHREAGMQVKLQAELDELRQLLNAKSSEETKRAEVAKSRDDELAALRSASQALQQELSNVRHTMTETQNKLRLDFDNTSRDLSSLQTTYESVVANERSAQEQLAKVRGDLSELERNKRAMDSELQLIRTKHIDIEGQLAEVIQAKDVSQPAIFHSHLMFFTEFIIIIIAT